MTEKTWTITYLDDTPSLKIEAESLVKAVDKVKDKLSYASLRCADLSGADLSGVDLEGTNLEYAHLRGADLSGADLRWADLRVADLSSANLIEADLSGADLSGADLSSADLSYANLSHASLKDAYLRGVDLSGADLSRADLSGAAFSCADLSGAEGLPPYAANMEEKRRRNNMGYYEINVVSEKLVGGYCFMCHSYSYSTNIITKKAIEFIWQYISNDKLMAAKQKLSFNSCLICTNGKPGIPKVTPAAKKVKTRFESYCLMFKPKHKFMQMTFTTARGREINVCITYRKEN